MIEKIIHQIWVGDFALPKRERKFIDALKEQQPDFEHILWTNENLPALPEYIQTVYDRFYSIKNFAFCADILRIYLVHSKGGFYFDIDFEFNPENNIRYFADNYDGMFLFHNDTDFTIPNNVFAAKKKSDILHFCLDTIDINCTWYGPSWMGGAVKNFLELQYESPQNLVKEKLQKYNYEYYNYGMFEKLYARHWSLYSWSPEVWTKMNNGEYDG